MDRRDNEVAHARGVLRVARETGLMAGKEDTYTAPARLNPYSVLTRVAAHVPCDRWANSIRWDVT
jgi:hypothetical protein